MVTRRKLVATAATSTAYALSTMLSLQNSDVARGGDQHCRKWSSSCFAPRSALAGCGGRAPNMVAAARGRGGSSGSTGDLRDPWRVSDAASRLASGGHAYAFTDLQASWVMAHRQMAG